MTSALFFQLSPLQLPLAIPIAVAAYTSQLLSCVLFPSETWKIQCPFPLKPLGSQWTQIISPQVSLFDKIQSAYANTDTIQHHQQSCKLSSRLEFAQHLNSYMKDSKQAPGQWELIYSRNLTCLRKYFKLVISNPLPTPGTTSQAPQFCNRSYRMDYINFLLTISTWVTCP